MKFSKKIFSAVFLTTLIVGSTLMVAAHRYVSKQSEEQFIDRYSVFSKVLSDTLSRLDKNTEALMFNAAKAVAAKDAEYGLLSTETLKGMRSELSVTHIFVVNKFGNFIRSTNEDPKLIPNVYLFCEKYKNLIAGTSKVEATPIIHPQPEPNPFKFLLVPTYDLERLIEVGVRVDFIAKTLAEALGADTNVVSMSLYTPKGISLGRFDSNQVDFNEARLELPTQFPETVNDGSHFKFYTKVESSHPKCCQCDKSGTSEKGEYYYILESKVSKHELASVQATTRNIFILLMGINLGLALLFSRILSRRLVKNIETAAKKVRSIKEGGNLNERIRLGGQDEVTYLTGEFDRLLDTLRESQDKTVESEKALVKVQLAKEVAHNIKSPTTAIEMVLPMLTGVQDKFLKVLHDAVHEIKALSARLSWQADSLSSGLKAISQEREAVLLSDILEAVVHEKQVEYSTIPGVKIEYLGTENGDDAYVNVDLIELRALISNLINNAVESYPQEGGFVKVLGHNDSNFCIFQVIDEGMGIPRDVIDQIGKVKITQGKQNGKGIGLLHANRVVTEWGGHISVNSAPGIGTQVMVSLPKINNSTKNKMNGT
ncbi:MAG: HAMP domain-containing histidine kinase [Planctomycetes bacterium]|nr:HAMP domain-containing histidine kinase [Planctomycetota bacterium]